MSTPPLQSYALPFAAFDTSNNPVDLGWNEQLSATPYGGNWAATLSASTPGISYITVGAFALCTLSYSAANHTFTFDANATDPLYVATLKQLGVSDPNFPRLGKFTVSDSLDTSSFMPTSAANRRAKQTGKTPAQAAQDLLADLKSGAISGIAMAPGDVLGKVGASSVAVSAELAGGGTAPLGFIFNRIATSAPNLLLSAIRSFPWIQNVAARSYLDLWVPPAGDTANTLTTYGGGKIACQFDDAAATNASLSAPTGLRRFIFAVPSGAAHATVSLVSGSNYIPVQLSPASGGAPSTPPASNSLTLDLTAPLVLKQTTQIVLGTPDPTLAFALQLSCPYADTTVAPDKNPQPFAVGVTDYPALETDSLPPYKTPALIVFYQDVRDGLGNVRPFDVTLSMTPAKPNVQWAVDPDSRSSGTLNNATQAQATFSNPTLGGVYYFDFSASGQFALLNLALPLAGAEIKEIVRADLARCDQFAQTALSRLDRANIIAHALDWFWVAGNGDYLGRPDHPDTPTLRRYNRMDSSGRGAVATWFGVPTRIAKASNFIFSYACAKLGISDWLESVTHHLGTKDDPSAQACYQAGRDVAGGANYDTRVTALVTQIRILSDVKNLLLWPNPNLANNHVDSQAAITNLAGQFVSPDFLNTYT